MTYVLAYWEKTWDMRNALFQYTRTFTHTQAPNGNNANLMYYVTTNKINIQWQSSMIEASNIKTNWILKHCYICVFWLPKNTGYSY
jgi:hypothetical protein